MALIQAIILGILQGVTEFFPVSSTGHLVLAEKFFNLKTGFVFDITLHFGTVLALILYFRKVWIKLVLSFLKSFQKWNLKEDENQRLAWYLAAATLPAAIIGYLLEGKVETIFRSPLVVVSMLFIFGIILALADKLGKKTKKLTQMRFGEALLVGLGQALALIPGVSRSGITITTGLFAGLRREAAVEFSFLLSMPIIFGAFLSHLFKIYNQISFENNLMIYFGGLLTSLVSSYLAIKYLLKYVRKHSLNIFVYYRIILAIIIIAYFVFS